MKKAAGADPQHVDKEAVVGGSLREKRAAIEASMKKSAAEESSLGHSKDAREGVVIPEGGMTLKEKRAAIEASMKKPANLQPTGNSPRSRSSSLLSKLSLFEKVEVDPSSSAPNSSRSNKSDESLPSFQRPLGPKSAHAPRIKQFCGSPTDDLLHYDTESFTPLSLESGKYLLL